MNGWFSPDLAALLGSPWGYVIGGLFCWLLAKVALIEVRAREEAGRSSFLYRAAAWAALLAGFYLGVCWVVAVYHFSVGVAS